jgi:alpha-beta hydrolase superfamily lysophospholipase
VIARRKIVGWMVVLLAGAFALWLVGSLAIAWRLSWRWSARFEEPMPEKMAARAENVRLKTRDGEELGAWYVPGANADAPSVAVFHGWRCTRTTRLGAAHVFEREGCATLLVTHRGHGDSTGEREDFGWSEQLDVIAAVDWLESRRPGARIIVDGASLGAVAATLAARELGPRVAGYVLECPFASLERATRERAAIFLPPVLDWIAYMGARLGAACFAPHWSQTAPIEAVSTIAPEIPVLFIAGELDRRAPLADVTAIAARVRGPHELTVIPHADHDRLMGEGGDEYAHAVRGWLATHFAARDR